MCILALVTNYSARFPFILITNRDEVFSRLTYPLAIDAATGLLWSVDGVAGGSWLGMELAHGRLATVTNCRRAPLAPLRGRPPLPPPWRGAALLSDVVAHTTCVCEGGTRQLVYTPPTSRGTIIRNYLVDGLLPGEGGGGGAADDPSGDELRAIPQTLRPPFYAGYNLITCDSLFGAATGTARPFTARFTTNRYAVECGEVLTHGEVHCLQNSYVDNWTEPKTAHLRDCFTKVLESLIAPLAEGRSGALSAAEAEAIATAFADDCLCERPQFDLRAMMADPARREPAVAADGGKTAMTLEELIASADPRLGFTEEELHQYFPPPEGTSSADNPITDGGAAERECELQRNIFKERRDDYGTRVQSVVFVEKQDNAGSSGYTTHFCQRPAGGKTWTHYTVSKEGGARQVSVS